MGGPLGIVHVTALNGSVARLVSCRERTWGGRPLTRGCPPHSSTLSPRCFLFRSPERRRCCRFCGRVFSLCCLAGGYAPPIGIAPAFFDSLCASYAPRCIICSRRGGSCARLTVRRCCAGRAVVCGVSRAWVWGSSGVLLGCERGRVSVSLVFFFEEATMPERGGASMLHSGSAPRVIE